MTRQSSLTAIASAHTHDTTVDPHRCRVKLNMFCGCCGLHCAISTCAARCHSSFPTCVTRRIGNLFRSFSTRLRKCQPRTHQSGSLTRAFYKEACPLRVLMLRAHVEPRATLQLTCGVLWRSSDRWLPFDAPGTEHLSDRYRIDRLQECLVDLLVGPESRDGDARRVKSSVA